ncbi:Sec-independent protein translocase protein TatB [Stakelama marina]|uniref:Twin-arginine translocase subunit TatB n=1 Tax=Stakelama marina TaxID=2826939 RepID=A0A8T4I834_9SPHN|nr:Sec-independent protein translocase protein TatB [Stakelama marina]MBR0551148.1 twin-arginine translocase subunit TatB [Stakelama marina]
MLDVAPTELLVVVVVAILIIGPKDLPKAMRFVGQWVGRARAISRQFRSGIDAVIREAELQELEKKWAAENERIMREHPPESLPAPNDEKTVESEADSEPRPEPPRSDAPPPDKDDDSEPQLPLDSTIAESGKPELTEKPVIKDEGASEGADKDAATR